MKPFKKYYEDNVFKPATPEEVEERFKLVDSDQALEVLMDDPEVNDALGNLTKVIQKFVDENFHNDVISKDELLQKTQAWAWDILDQSNPGDISPIVTILVSEIE